MGIPGELGKENITAFNSADLNNIQSNMEQDSDYKDLLSAKNSRAGHLRQIQKSIVLHME